MVRNSRIQCASNAKSHLQDFLVQKNLKEDFLSPFEDELKNAKSIFDKHILMWCVENYVPLCQFSPGEILVVFYEDICQRPQEEIQKIYSFIGENFSPDIVKKSKKPSALSVSHGTKELEKYLISSWRKNISKATLHGP